MKIFILSVDSIFVCLSQLTVAFGNLIVILVVGYIKISYQALEFGLFAALMLIDMMIFVSVGYFYKPISLEEVDKAE